jgi:hypothetical protein
MTVLDLSGSWALSMEGIVPDMDRSRVVGCDIVAKEREEEGELREHSARTELL